MSSVARCYTPLKTNIYIKPKDQYEIRRDSFEIGVFEASNYYSSIFESFLTDHANNADSVLDDGKHDHSINMHSINLVGCYEQEDPKKIKKLNKQKKCQPSSPGAKLASYLHSIVNQTLVSKSKRKKPVLFDDDKKSSRSSSMSLARCVDMAEAASVHSCPSYTSYSRQRPTQTLTKSANARALDHIKRGYKDHFRTYSSCSSKQSDHLQDVERFSSDERSWPALTWFDQELKIRKQVPYTFKGLKKVKEEDGMESDSSSDLFELQDSVGELPVRKTTNMNNVKLGSK